MPHQILETRVGGAAGLLCMLTDRIDEALIATAPGLRVISQMAVGVDNIDVAAARAFAIQVGHTPDVLTETTADTAMALVLAAARRLREGIDYVREGRWGPWDPTLLLGQDVHHATLGIVGLGRIGTAVATRAAGFGMRVLYTGPNRKPTDEARLGVLYRTLGDLLSESDHVVVTAPLIPATRHLIDRKALRRMRPSATIVNVSRGGLVDQDALYDALARGEVFAAALDVTDPEPMPTAHPLLTLSNCTVIPHLGSSSRQTRVAMASLAVDNLVAGLQGGPLPAPFEE